MAYTVTDIINWAKISQYLSQKDISIGDATGKTAIDERHPRILYLERKSLEYINSVSPSNQYIREVANYVLQLCGKFLFEAQRISASGGGGVIVNPTSTTAVPPTIFVLGTDLSGNVYTNTTYAGFNLTIFYNGIKYLKKDTDFTVNTGGGFTFIGSYAGGTYGSDTEFVMSTNGLL